MQSWASPFFLSLTDSSTPPLGWTHGPLHAGGNGGTSCLDTKYAMQHSVHREVAELVHCSALLAAKSDDASSGGGGGISVGVAIGTLLAGLVVGGLLGFFIPFFIRRHQDREKPHMGSKRSTPASDDSHILMRPGRSLSTRTAITPYAMEPYMPASPPPSSPPVAHTAPSVQSMSADYHSHSHSMSMAGAGSQVYVIHQDAGRPPVSVVVTGNQGQDMTVTELPPNYVAAGSDGIPPPVPREKGRPFRR